MKTIYAALLGLALCASAHADSVFTVIGSTTLTGNDVCNGVCTETIAFDFQVSYQAVGTGAFIASLLPGSTVNSTGPLAPSSFLGAGPQPDNYFPLFNALGSEVDLDGPFGDAELTNTPFPQLIGAELFGCGVPPPFGTQDQTCIQDFVPPGGVSFGHVLFTSVNYQVSGPVATPEPSSLVLLACGLALLLRRTTLAAFFSRQTN